MSNAGNLFNQEYTKAVVSMGEQKEVASLVSGFISQSRVSKVNQENLLLLVLGSDLVW